MSWLNVPKGTDFSLRNLPLGVFTVSLFSTRGRRCATRLGDTLIDLAVLEEAGLFDDIPGLQANVFCQETLNAFVAHPRPVWIAFRLRLIELFTNPDSRLSTNSNLQQAAFYDSSKVTLHLPLSVGDYTDFYSSREHATNVGIMFRGKDNALQPNWLHLPVGYHGRSSTVVVSGTSITRPCGQLQKNNDDPNQGSVYGPCRLLDFELEMAAVVGGPSNPVGQPLSMEQAKERIFGFMLMNDWSARDIQKWEYVPLGPFTSKNFATTVSPWIVMALALDDFVAPTSAGEKGQVDPVPLPYLRDPNYSSYDIALTVAIQPATKGGGGQQDTEAVVVSRSNFRNMYWNAAQQLVHHAVTGCVMNAGDLLGSGTISGSELTSFGSMLELSWKGSRTVSVGNSETRKFLLDGDTVIMTGVCSDESDDSSGRVGFGECSGTILPAVAIDTSLLHQTTVEVDAAPKKVRFVDWKLYSYWRSSSSWRVRVALAAKGIEYEMIPVNILLGEQRAESFLSKNPSGQVPLLEVKDTEAQTTLRISQSLAVVDFLDKAFPNRRSLIPSDPVERAFALEMTEVINSGTQPLQNVIYLRQLQEKSGGTIRVEDQAKQVNERGLAALEAMVVSQQHRRGTGSGPYCLGTFSPSVVDVFMVPQLYNSRRFGVDVAAICPELAKIETLCLEHSWFKTTHPSVQADAKES